MIKLTDEEHRFLDGIDSCVYLVDPEGRLIDANTSWQIFFATISQVGFCSLE